MHIIEMCKFIYRYVGLCSVHNLYRNTKSLDVVVLKSISQVYMIGQHHKHSAVLEIYILIIYNVSLYNAHKDYCSENL